MLFGAGLAGGIVTAIVGGASLITFPALLAAGLPPIVANASNTVAMTPGNFMGGLADLERRPRWDRSFLGLLVVCVGGSAAGAVLLLMTPEKAFTAVVPLLIGFATLLFAQSGRIRRWIRAPRMAAGDPLVRPGGDLRRLLRRRHERDAAGAPLDRSCDDFRATNVLKNLLSGLTSFVAVVVFMVQGVVAWPSTLAMMAGALIGGFLGGRLVRVLPPRWCAGSSSPSARS